MRDLDTDFLACSAYKWFGPHLGALYGKAEVLDALPAFKVRPAHDRFETGTANFEGIAGTLAATDYLRDVGRSLRRRDRGRRARRPAASGGASSSPGWPRSWPTSATLVAPPDRRARRRCPA